MSESPLYRIEALKHRYGGNVVLDIDSLEIAPGTIVGLAGPNGSGKSTLLRLLGFINKPTDGTILFKGEPSAPFDDKVRFRVTLLPQDPYLMKRTVFENIVYGLKLRREQPQDHEKRVHEALAQVGLDAGDFAPRQWNELSGGEAQRVALAARLVLKPEVLLLDEPTAGVDVHSSQLIRRAAVSVRSQQGTTLIVASHDREWLDEISDHVICLFKGRITGRDRDNIVFGPWRSREDGGCEKVMSDGQVLMIPNASAVPAVASIDPAGITIVSSNAPCAPASSHLNGTITRLAMAPQNGRMILTLRAGDLTLTASVQSRLVETHNLYPGKPAFVEIPAAAVNWIPL